MAASGLAEEQEANAWAMEGKKARDSERKRETEFVLLHSIVHVLI